MGKAETMPDNLVIGIDSSTTATKTVAFDRNGNAVAEGRAAIAMTNPQAGFYEQDPSDWWQSLQAACQDLGRKIDLARVAAVSISNQRETIAILNDQDEALRPGILWLDERGRPDVELLSQSIGRERLLQITGKTPDPTPALYGLHWLKRHEPESLTNAAMITDVHGFLVRKLTGAFATSWASADPPGLYDLAHKCYSPELLDLLGLTTAQLPRAERPASIMGSVTDLAAAGTGLPAGTKIVAGGGDGQAAGLGTGTIKPGRAYFNLGTAAVSGVFGQDYGTDPAFRTLLSLTGDGYIFELCLRTGTFLVDWYVKDLLGANASYQELEAQAAELPIGASGLILQPYWLGVMNPYWDQHAKGTIIGLSSEHGPAHLYRALLEGIALDEAMGLRGIEQVTGRTVDEILAIGGGSNSPLWCQIIADATGKPVHCLGTAEASALGAAMTAAVAAGWFADAHEASTAMSGHIERSYQPDNTAHGSYAELLSIYQELYPTLSSAYAKLGAFRTKQ